MIKRKTTFSSRFSRDIVLTALTFSVLATGAVGYLVSQVRRDISENYIHEASARAAEEFEFMQESVVDSLGLVREWGESGLLSLSKPDELNKLLFPIFGREPMLAGISIADSEGRSYFIQADGTERKPSDADDFDPRLRPWFAPALESSTIYWTDQYLFHTLRQLGVTVSASFIPPKGKQKLVVAFDVLLPDLYRKIKEKAPSENSDIFIFRHDELLFLPEGRNASSSFIPLGSVTNGLISDARAFWGRDRASSGEVFSFIHQGTVWWCGFQSLGGPRQNVWMGVMVPESDIMGDIGRRRLLLIFGLVIVLSSVGGAAGLSYRYSRAVGAVKSTSIDSSEAGILALIEKGENRSVEFKSTMRMNLHTQKPGKEIEIAWLKGVAGFLNTDGGTLLLGVTDEGEVTGLERDVFENEDKCRLHFKNLVAAHIGAEMSKHIRFFLVPVAGKTIGMVHCSRSAEPIFLKNGNKEAFYIRNGPSSDELPVSKALNYIEHRK